MQKRKHSWAAFVGGGNKKGEKMAGENARILPKATQEERKKQEAKRKGKLKTLAGKLLKTVVGGKEMVEKAGAEDVAGNLLKRPSSRKGVERGTPAEEIICRFIEQGKFLEACDQIHNLEHSGNDGLRKSESLYVLLAERMWTVVGEALSGSDRMLLEPLQSVGESLKWEKQKEAERLGNGLETDPVSTWSPNFWRKDLEEKLIQYMTAQIPPFASSSDTDETALNQHLSQLETKFLPSLEHSSDVFRDAGLLVTYARCCHASLCSHLATLTDSNCFSFSQSLLIYGWSIKMYKRGSQACVRPEHSLSLGAQCLVWILLKTEEKLLATARKEVGKALKGAFDLGKPPCADAAVIEILTEKTEAARRVSESLSEKVEAECLEECLRFLESYEDEVRSFLQLDGCPQICSSLRILENCCLLRTVWHKLTYICSVSTDQNVKVNGFLHRMEDDIMEHFLQTITSKLKGTLKDHFKKCDSGFDHILESLKQNFLTFGKKNTDTYEVLVKAVNAIIITEYMQALLTTPRKTSAMQRRRIVNKIEEDHRMMQTIFKECLGPAAGSLKDPIKAILELVQTSDPEGMKIALLPILKEFPDLRKEHLSAVLDIKDSLSREDRAALLKAFHDNCSDSETETNLLFADIEVKPRKYGLCGCLCC
ncbi:exocyst complex component 3-like isoform X1 [Pyrgilauda ruficollis]|uniref:exocyst complex component 3-like isoform X1 n=2 Tax=Pyrgilauda ruficollis TaxID=221976 RepID=UPI001B882201|nr:exocyst complex component 3-like isoform X1 [Pyrgilauda ruficollis]XP_041332117.1 exocyst complex component 3-like isoform X1 [Pyrgilauda ruficollis]XP_041332118.1 exocyst complex component 3-like isoform X1 [Pyrgilauda ruficollis]XP_041332120.1 exocyst complex component 3-like isoform X1 [Pyrgilauda ruficollis]XP_041332121.1 exocyst complex component 3-like isoform X1 [Pyrgilauda ruficollis]XP_041332122.1 exocyst complex component 3-like isoform X1 [Pyrgilauda ruficollis]XP_041332123.1 ex